jgi:toxin CcdB
MAQFDVFAQPFARNPDIPYVIALQSDLLEQFGSAVVAPLRKFDSAPQFRRLTPLLVVDGKTFLFTPTELVSVPARLLGAPVANLSSERDSIIAALDVLFTGI